MKHSHSFFILVGTIAIAYGQKVVPGVNPAHYVDQNQHYQQPPPQVQYVQPGQPMHQMPPQGQPIQHVQPPVQPMHQDPNMIHQQQQQQQQQQQHPQQHQQMAGAPQIQRHPQQVLDTANIQGEKAHIQEHIDVPMDTSKMSEQELQFHYFKMHDSDHNNKLDGCELIKSLIHWHEKTNKDGAAHHQEEPGHHDKIFSDEELVALIDPILAMDDTGRDGYIDYPEFIKAQQKAAAQNKAEKP